jgi:hypothetical protein
VGHPEIDNQTPYAFEPLFLVDEEWRPLVVPVVKGTFAIQHGGRCALADEQLPLLPSGQCWGKDPETSSYRYEPEVAFFKPNTDVVLNGHAHAPRSGTREMRVSLRVGPLARDLRVVGDRVWFRSLGAVAISDPTPFERMPLVYERAFGGWDRSDPNPERHSCERRNPVGLGFCERARFEDGLRLPNIEDPREPLSALTDKPAPAGFGFVSPHWQPRAGLAGTYDAAWQQQRAPLLPRDFDRRHLNASSAGLTARGYLRGDEQVSMLGVTPDGSASFELPGVAAPQVSLRLDDGPHELSLALDTVIIEPDERRVQLLWRGHASLRTGPHELRALQVSNRASA